MAFLSSARGCRQIAACLLTGSARGAGGVAHLVAAPTLHGAAPSTRQVLLIGVNGGLNRRFFADKPKPTGPVADFRNRELDLTAVGYQQAREKERQNAVQIQQEATAEKQKAQQRILDAREEAVRSKEVPVDIVLLVEGVMIPGGNIKIPVTDYGRLKKAQNRTIPHEAFASSSTGNDQGEKGSTADKEQGPGSSSEDQHHQGYDSSWINWVIGAGTLGAFFGLLGFGLVTQEDKRRFLEAFILETAAYVWKTPFMIFDKTIERLAEIDEYEARKAEDAQDQSLRTEAGEETETETKAGESHDAKAKAGESRDAKTKAAESRDDKTKSAEARGAKAKAAEAQDAKTKAAEAQDAKTKAAEAQDAKTKAADAPAKK